MVPDLPDRDRERFAALRERLEGVSQSEQSPAVIDAAPGPIDPMLTTGFDGDLDGVPEDNWIAERKYDGTRIILEKFDGAVSLYTRRHIERSQTLSELTSIATEYFPDGLILDGEYTYLTPDGMSHFVPIHSGSKTVNGRELTDHFFVFDVIARDHEWCTRMPLMERKAELEAVVPEVGLVTIADVITSDFNGFFDDLVERGEEGIILKRRGSPYHIGERSAHWKKVKAFIEVNVLAVGYTPGEGRRKPTFGALVMTDGERYVGRVGSGFNDTELLELLEEMEPVADRPVPVDQVGMPYTPVEPFVIQVKYLEVTESGDLRAPVFLRLRPDKPIDDVTPISP